MLTELAKIKIVSNLSVPKSVLAITCASLLGMLAIVFENPVIAKSAKCLLVVDGKTYINGYCKFEFEDGDGSFSFSDEKQRLGCYEYDLGPGRCSGAATKILKNGTFGGLNIQRPGVGKFWWNSGVLRKGESVMKEPLYRSGACWQSSRVKLCAW